MTRQKWFIAVASLLCMAVGAGMVWRVKGHQRLGDPGLKLESRAEVEKGEIDLPARVRQYTSTNLPPTDVEVGTLPADTTFGRRLYTSPNGFQLMLNVVLMGSDRTSIHKPEFCLPAQGWQIGEPEDVAIEIKEPHVYRLPVRKYIARMITRTAEGEIARLGGVYAFWFVAADRITADHWARLWYLSWDLLRTGVLPRWAYVSCFAVCHPGEEEATFARMKSFLAAAVPEFQLATLPEVPAETPGSLPSKGAAK